MAHDPLATAEEVVDSVSCTKSETGQNEAQRLDAREAHLVTMIYMGSEVIIMQRKSQHK